MANFPTSISTDSNLYIAVNGLQTTLAVAVGTGDTTLTLASTSGFPTTGMVTVDNNEIVAYTGVSGADLTGCTRGADGTTAVSHAIGVTVGLTVVAAHHNRLKDEIIAVETALGASFAKGNLTAASSKISIGGTGTGAVLGAGASVDLGTVTLDDLSDVLVSAPAVNDALQFNGIDWINAPVVATSAGPGIQFFNETPVIKSRTSPSGLTQNGVTGTGIAINSLGIFPITTAEQTAVGTVGADTRAYVAWLYDTVLDRVTIDAGVWQFETWAGVNSVASGRSTTLTRTIYQVVPGTTTVDFSGGGANSRTATITSGQFSGTNFSANATNTVASYIQATSGTDKGLYQITATGSTDSATVTVQTGYTNETGVTFNVWNRLLSSTTNPITAISPNYALQTFSTVRPAFTIANTDKLGAISFITGTVAGGTTVTIAYNGTARNTHFSTPLITLHNDLAGLQGGSASERYHLSSAGATAAEALVSAPSLPLTGGTMTGDITMSNDKAIIFKETTGNGTDSVTVKAPASVTTSYTIQLPPAVASAGQVLTDVAGNGVLSWTATGVGTVNTGTAGRIAVYPASSDAVDDVYTQNSQPIDLLIEAQGSRSAALAITIPNPGNAVTAASVVLTQGAQTISGIKTFDTQIIGKGTATNDSAAAGYIGEYVESVVSFTNVPASTTNIGDATSISLTAGDWDVSAVAQYSRSGATWTDQRIAISSTAGNSLTGLVFGSNYIESEFPVATSNCFQCIPTYRVSIASTTTHYLKVRVDYTVATPQVACRLSARRIR